MNFPFEIVEVFHNRFRTCFNINEMGENIASSSDIDALIEANAVIQDFSRLKDSTIQLGGETVVFWETGFYSNFRPRTAFHNKIIRGIDRILSLRPSASGGKSIELTLEQVLGSETLETTLSEFEIHDARVTEFLCSEIFLSGKIFKSHEFRTYYFALESIFRIFQFYSKNPGGEFVFYHEKRKEQFSSVKNIRDEYYEKLLHVLSSKRVSFRWLAGRTGGRKRLIGVETRPRRVRPTLDKPGMRTEIIKLWAAHFERTEAAVEYAMHRYRKIQRSRWSREYTDEHSADNLEFLHGLETLSTELIDALSEENIELTQQKMELPEPSVGAPEFTFAKDGILETSPAVRPSVSIEDLTAKYKLARHFIADFESLVRGLENTHYRSFSRFVPPLNEALGDELESADSIMLIGLHGPFVKLLQAAESDEAREASEHSEFEPILATRREQLVDIADSIAQLAEALDGYSQLQTEQEKFGVSEEDIAENFAPIGKLLEILDDESPETAKKIEKYLALLNEANGNGNVIAHLIIATIANLMLGVARAVDRAKTEDPDNLDIREVQREVEGRDRLGWNKFRETVGQSTAIAICGTLGTAGTYALVQVTNWFSGHGAVMMERLPTVFNTLSSILRLLF